MQKKSSSDYRLIVKGPKVCNGCGSWDNLQVHHKDGNHENNSPDNLEWLCVNCHSKKHKRYIPRFETSEDIDISFRFNPKFTFI